MTHNITRPAFKDAVWLVYGDDGDSCLMFDSAQDAAQEVCERMSGDDKQPMAVMRVINDPDTQDPCDVEDVTDAIVKLCVDAAWRAGDGYPAWMDADGELQEKYNENIRNADADERLERFQLR